MHGPFKKIAHDESGAVAIEYVLIAAFVAVMVIAGASLIGSNLSTLYFAPVAGNL